MLAADVEGGPAIMGGSFPGVGGEGIDGCGAGEVDILFGVYVLIESGCWGLVFRLMGQMVEREPHSLLIRAYQHVIMMQGSERKFMM